MSRARHRASGGSVKKTVYAGAGSNVMKEGEERKSGGGIKGEGEMPKPRADKRARGGAVGRQRGGGVGSNLKPLSTAANVKHITKGETPEKGEPSN